MADAYLPVVFHDVPAAYFFEVTGRLTRQAEHYTRLGVLRVIAGPHLCHAVIDIRRPYNRPPKGLAEEIAP